MRNRCEIILLLTGVAVVLILGTLQINAQRPSFPSPTFPVQAPNQNSQCLHFSNESPEQIARRSRAFNAVQTIGTLQLQHKGATGFFMDVDALRRHTDVSAFISSNPDWDVELMSTPDAYAVLARDLLDPCNFALFGGRDGRVYGGTPVR